MLKNSNICQNRERVKMVAGHRLGMKNGNGIK